MRAKAPGSKAHEAHKGQYTFKWVVGKMTGDGEQSSVEVIANPSDLPQMVGLAYSLLDQRMFQQNQRYQDFLEVAKELPPETRVKLNQCIDVAFGRAKLEDLARVKREHEEETRGEQDGQGDGQGDQGEEPKGVQEG